MKTFNYATEQQHLSMILDAINDDRITDDNIEDLHHIVFNEDYFIIGYFQAEQWIKENFDSVFGAIETVIEYEKESFGESHTKINSEAIANMLSYICGEYVISDNDLHTFETVEELKEALESLLED